MSSEPDRTARARLVLRVGALVGALVAVVATVVATSSLLLTGGREEAPAGEMLPLHYTGEFRYQAASPPIWCAMERVELDRRVLNRVTRESPVAARGAAGVVGAESSCSRVDDQAPAETATTTRGSRANRPPADADPRLSVALGPRWQYQGTRGLDKRRHVYRRYRTLPVRLPPDETTVSVINQVALPVVELGRVRLIPDDTSTMRFEGPSRVLRATSPQAKPEHFAGQVAYTVPLRDLVRDLRIEIGRPATPERSFGERVTDWLGGAASQSIDWMWSLIGLIITTAVAAIVGAVALDAWNKRRRPRAPPARHRRR